MAGKHPELEADPDIERKKREPNGVAQRPGAIVRRTPNQPFTGIMWCNGGGQGRYPLGMR